MDEQSTLLGQSPLFTNPPPLRLQVGALKKQQPITIDHVLFGLDDYDYDYEYMMQLEQQHQQQPFHFSPHSSYVNI